MVLDAKLDKHGAPGNTETTERASFQVYSDEGGGSAVTIVKEITQSRGYVNVCCSCGSSSSFTRTGHREAV